VKTLTTPMLLFETSGSSTLSAPAPRQAAIHAGPIPVPRVRDGRIDMFRGLALLTMFVNHVPGTFYENLTSRNFGFSDAAEGFVFISGVAAGLAYAGRDQREVVRKAFARAKKIYLVHLVVTLLVLAIFAAVALWLGQPQVLAMNGIPLLLEHPLEAIVGLPLLTYQIDYVNILPLYVVLLLATPVFVLIAQRWPWLLLGASILLWAFAAHYRVDFPNYPGTGGWFLNPLSWQLIFIVGLLCGIAQRNGRVFVPYHPVLLWAATAFLILALFWVRIHAVGDVGRLGVGWLAHLGVPDYLDGFDKPYLFLPRLLHAFALFYVLAGLGIVRRFAESQWAQPLRLLGRHSLAVFAVGSVLSLTIQALRSGLQPNLVADGFLLAGSMILLVSLAQMLTTMRTQARKSEPR
jgi:hypothetical protein